MAQLWRAQVSGGAAIWAASNGDGTPTTPAFGTITPAATSITFAHVGGGTHYRIYTTGGAAGSLVSLGGPPVTVSSLTVNTPYTIDLSADGSTVAATTNTGTLNPATGGGEPVPNVPIEPQAAQETDAAFSLFLAQILGVAVESDQAVPLALITPGAITAAEESDQAVSLALVSPMVLGVALESDEAVSLDDTPVESNPTGAYRRIARHILAGRVNADGNDVMLRIGARRRL